MIDQQLLEDVTNPPPPLEDPTTDPDAEEGGEGDDAPAQTLVQPPPDEFDPVEALRHQAIMYMSRWEDYHPIEDTAKMLCITIKIDGVYDTSKKDCTFGSLVVKAPQYAAFLELFIRVLEPFIKPPCKKDQEEMLDSEKADMHNPKVIFRLWKGQTECNAHSAFSIFIRGARTDGILRDKIDTRFRDLCKGDPANVHGLSLQSLLSDYLSYCWGKRVGSTTQKLTFTQVFSYGATKALLAGKKYTLEGLEGDPDTRTYVPDGDYVLMQNKFFFWDCIQDVPFFWIGRSLLDHGLDELFRGVTKTLRTDFREDIRTITSIAASNAKSWGRWMTPDEAKKKAVQAQERAETEARDRGLTVQEINANGGLETRKKDRASKAESLAKIAKDRADARKSEKARMAESSDRVWVLFIRAMRHFQYLNGPIEAVTEAFKLLEKEVEESGKYLTDAELDDYFNCVFSHPSIQQRLPNAILGAWSHMREAQVSHRYPFVLHWGGKADMVSEIRKSFLDFFAALCGSDNCTTMGIELNTMRLTATDLSCIMPQNEIFEGPASAGKSRTADIIKKISCSGTIVGNTIQESAKSGMIAVNPFDFATQIYSDMGAAMTKDYKTLNAQEQEKIMTLQIRISDQIAEYTTFASKALEDRGADAFQARDSVHIETQYRGPSAFICNKGFSKPEMRARVQEFQIGLATTRAINMMSSVVSESIDKSLADKRIGGDNKDVATEVMIMENAEEGKSYQAACIMNGLYRHIIEHDRYYSMPAEIIALNLIKWLAEEYRGMQRMSNSVTNPRRFQACTKKIHANAVLRSYALMHWMEGGKYKFDPTKKECFYINNIGSYMHDLSQQQIGSTCEAIHAVATMLPDLCDENLARIFKTIGRDFLKCSGYDLNTKGGRSQFMEKLHGPGAPMNGKVMFMREKRQQQQQQQSSGSSGNGGQAFGGNEHWINPNYIEYHTDMTPEQFCASIASNIGIGMVVSSDAVHQKLFQDEKGKLLKDWGVTGTRLPGSVVGDEGSEAVELENCGIVLKPINVCVGTRLRDAASFMRAFEEDTSKPQIMRFGYRLDTDAEGRKEYVYTFAVELFDGTGNTKSPASLLKQIVEEKLPYKNQMFTGVPEIDEERIRLYIELNHPGASAEEKRVFEERYRNVGVPIKGYFLDYTDRTQQVAFVIEPTYQSPDNFTFKNPRFTNSCEEKNIISVIEDLHSRNAFVRDQASHEADERISGFGRVLDNLRRRETVTMGLSMDMLAWWPLAHRYRWTTRQWVDEVLREPRAMVATWNKYLPYYKQYLPMLMDNEDRRARLREFARRMDLNPEDTITNWLKVIVTRIAPKPNTELLTIVRKAYPAVNINTVGPDHPAIRLHDAFTSYQRESGDVSVVAKVDPRKIAEIDHESPTAPLAVIIRAMEECASFGGSVLRVGDISNDRRIRLNLKGAGDTFDKERRRHGGEDDAAYNARMMREGRDSPVLRPVPTAAPRERRERYVSKNSQEVPDEVVRKNLRAVLVQARGRCAQRPRSGANERTRMEKAAKATAAVAARTGARGTGADADSNGGFDLGD